MSCMVKLTGIYEYVCGRKSYLGLGVLDIETLVMNLKMGLRSFWGFDEFMKVWRIPLMGWVNRRVSYKLVEIHLNYVIFQLINFYFIEYIFLSIFIVLILHPCIFIFNTEWFFMFASSSTTLRDFLTFHDAFSHNGKWDTFYHNMFFKNLDELHSVQ